MRGKPALIESIANQKMPDSLEEQIRPDEYLWDNIWHDEVWQSSMWFIDKDGTIYEIVVHKILHVESEYDDATRIEFFIP